MRTALAATLLPLTVLTGCHVPGHVDDWGAPPAQRQQDDGCPPPVSFTTPGSGTVVDVRDCPGLFNTGIRYARVEGTDSGIGSRTVWTSNGAGCKVGSAWSEIGGC
jgi:hypothetical protein